MLPLTFNAARDALVQILCLGAHSDDIEIGCGGTLLKLQAIYPRVRFHWVVFSADERRACEARRSVDLFLQPGAARQVVVHAFRDGFLPAAWGDVKERFEALKTQISPDLVFTHHRADRHQDHRVVSELTWNTFRDHLILEYEIPKYDGDLGSPNCYVALDETTCRRKVDYVVSAFESQRGKRWFTAETFYALMRIRGVEAAAPGGYAEAFYVHKLLLGG
jgi:LmbE family N-acetylglucosaminyl deacetylase